jgi:hypothetical protein
MNWIFWLKVLSLFLSVLYGLTIMVNAIYKTKSLKMEWIYVVSVSVTTFVVLEFLL